MKGDTVESYIARVFPCRKLSDPPESCDSFGVCDNCCDAALIKAGAEIQSRQVLKKPEDCTDVNEIYPIITAYEVRRDQLRTACKHPTSTPKMYMWRVGAFYPTLICDTCHACVDGITAEQSDVIWKEWNKPLQVST